MKHLVQILGVRPAERLANEGALEASPFQEITNRSFARPYSDPDLVGRISSAFNQPG